MARSANLKYNQPSRARGAVGSYHKDIARNVHGIINPFSDDARGTKIPDENSSRSVAVTVKGIYDLTSSGTTYAAYFKPSLKQVVTKANVITAGEVTSWGTPQGMTDTLALEAGFTSYRIVSWGLRVYTTSALLSQSGNYRFITLSENPTGGITALNSSLYESVEDFPAPQGDVSWTSRPMGDEFKQYVPMASEQAWDGVLFYASGLPTDAPFARAEVVFNIEAQTKIGSVTGGVATPAAKHHPVKMTAADHARAQTKHADHSKSLVKTLWDTAKSSVISAVSAYGSPLLGAGANALMNWAMPKKRPLAIEVD
jgi:hypothetical protein